MVGAGSQRLKGTAVVSGRVVLPMAMDPVARFTVSGDRVSVKR